MSLHLLYSVQTAESCVGARAVHSSFVVARSFVCVAVSAVSARAHPYFYTPDRSRFTFSCLPRSDRRAAHVERLRKLLRPPRLALEGADVRFVLALEEDAHVEARDRHLPCAMASYLLPALKKSCMLSLTVCATARLKRPCRQKPESQFLFRRVLSRTNARQTYST